MATAQVAVDSVRDALKEVYDPEIPVNIYEMGLIYEIDIQQDGMVNIKMTLTSPNCPAAQSLPAEVETKVKAIDEVLDASIEIVWEPAWHIDMMTEDAKLELGID